MGWHQDSCSFPVRSEFPISIGLLGQGQPAVLEACRMYHGHMDDYGILPTVCTAAVTPFGLQDMLVLCHAELVHCTLQAGSTAVIGKTLSWHCRAQDQAVFVQ